MRKYFYFARHGESLSNLDPATRPEHDHLSEAGREQAVLTGAYFAKIPIGALYHSGTLRTEQTAAEISATTGTTPETIPLLTERHGSFSSSGTFEPSENFVELEQRLTRIQSFLESAPNKHTVIVAHAIFLKALAALLVFEELFSEPILSKFDSTIVLDNAGISQLMFNEEKHKWRILSWNKLNHLKS